jgi:hypothetical protein
MNHTSYSSGGTHEVVVRHGYDFTITLYTHYLNTSLKIGSPDLKKKQLIMCSELSNVKSLHKARYKRLEGI